MELKIKIFDELTTKELYEILKSRAEIFIVEQNCVYQTGRYVFWIGIIGLPILFSRKVRIKSTWINMPLFFVSWYVCTWIFGESPKHRYLGHPSSGWITIGEGLDPVGVMILFWLIQFLVLLMLTVIRSGVRKKKGKDRRNCV